MIKAPCNPKLESAREATESPRSNPGPEEAMCRKVIAAYRDRLAYILMTPELEEIFERGLEALELPGARKGIGLRAAINALLIENKYGLIRWAFLHYRHRFSAQSARRIDRMFGLDLFNSLELDEYLTERQWSLFRDRLLFVLGRHYRRYKRAQGTMFQAYRRMVEITVNRGVFDAGKRADASQEGALALLHAIDKVEDSDASFAAYAQAWIKRQVKNYLMGERFPVHVPVNLASKTLSRQDTEKKEEDQAPLSLTERKKALLMERLRQPSISLNEVMEDSSCLADRLPDDLAVSPVASLSQKDLCGLVARLTHHLTAKQREVLELRFGLRGRRSGYTLTEISKKIGISHQQVSMREKRALQKLQGVLAPYLEEIYE